MISVATTSLNAANLPSAFFISERSEASNKSVLVQYGESNTSALESENRIANCQSPVGPAVLALGEELGGTEELGETEGSGELLGEGLRLSMGVGLDEATGETLMVGVTVAVADGVLEG